MELYNLYYYVRTVLSTSNVPVPGVFYYALAIGGALWIGLFVLQGFGLYAMAKRRGMQDKWKAFVPFVNIQYIGKLTGDCYVFGKRLKHAGLFAMIAQILTTLFYAIVVASEIYLSAHGTLEFNVMNMPYWTGLTGFSLTVFKIYDAIWYFLFIVQLIYRLFILVLLLELYKKYSPKNYTTLGFLGLFLPLSRYIVIFVLRKRKAINYEAYIRARHEAYMRQRQQYQNPYGNPYNNPYGNPYGNPYANAAQGQNAPKPEEPFAEFSGNKTERDNAVKNDNDPDDFFS